MSRRTGCPTGGSTGGRPSGWTSRFGPGEAIERRDLRSWRRAGAVEVPFVVASAEREREVAQVPRRGTCKCVRAGSAVCELFRGRCAVVMVGARGMSRRRTNCRLGAGDEWPCSASQGYAVTAQSLGRSVESRLVCIRREWSPPCESAFHQPASRWAAPISTWPHRHPPASRIGFRPRSWTTATGSLRLMMLVSPG
jgi:hypothetical protein